MQVAGENQYKCDPDERIWIKFVALPSRNNVNIRQAWDNDPPPMQKVAGDFISFKMGAVQRQLILEFDFILQGTCNIRIEGENGGADIDISIDTGIPDIKRYTFVP